MKRLELFSRNKNIGFSLIELLVSMAIGLVLTLAITSVMTNSEGTKLATTTLNDTNQTGAYVAYELDRSIRSAGSGFMQSWSPGTGGTLGCRLTAAYGDAQILPRPQPVKAPFDGMPADVKLAPFVITRGLTSDILTVMSGSSGFAEVGRRVLPGSITENSARLLNVIGWHQDDLVLFSEGGGNCMIQQVGAIANPLPPATQKLPLGGPYASKTIGTTSLTGYGANTFAIALGNIGTTRNNPPSFQYIGVDSQTNTLVSFDLLTTPTGGSPIGADATPIPIANGVVAIRAMYGLDTNNDGIQESAGGKLIWQEPTGNFESTKLLDGTVASQALLKQIVSVKLAVILNTGLIEKEVVAPEELTVFEGEVLKHKVTDRHIRHRVIELTIPLRNVLLL